MAPMVLRYTAVQLSAMACSLLICFDKRNNKDAARLGFIENKRQDRARSPPLSFSSKMLSVCLEFEEIGEDEGGDCSKDIILEMGSIFCKQNF